MSSNIFRKKTVVRIVNKYNFLGKKNNAIFFLNLRLIICILVFIIFLFIPKSNMLISLIVSIFLYYFIEYAYFDLRIKKRKKQIEDDALVFFGLLSLSLKNNNNLILSLTLASKKKDNIISCECTKLLKDMDYGKSLKDALNDMTKKIPNENINTIILSLKEYTNNIENFQNILNKQLKYLEEKVIFNKRKQIISIPFKIKILSFIFVLICSFLVFYIFDFFGLF